MYVVKASGKKEEFNPGKILSTLRRAGATQKLANEIENEVEKKAYDGITTREILDNALELLKSRKPEVADIYDLKRAIMTLGPTGFPFEKFFAEVLRNYGYETQIDQIVSGKFSTHEIDISAVKKNIRYMVEAKYHNTQGVYTDLKVVLYVYARFLDLKRKFDVPWIVTNTRISSNAMNYSKGVGIKITSWKYPGKESLEGLIEGKKLYPITILKSVNESVKGNLIRSGIVMVKDLLNIDFGELQKRTKISREDLASLVEEAGKVYKVKVGK